MRVLAHALLLLSGASLWLAPAASAVSADWVTVGHPGNRCDVQFEGCFGGVAQKYRISKFEVTNAQYAEFLNAKAASDPLALYTASTVSGSAGIARSGSSGSYTYSAIAAREGMPVVGVSFYDVLRFVNWLHNGQRSGDTETGAYTLLGGTPTPSNGSTVTRNPGANIFLPSEDEWYKAAYYDVLSESYFSRPAGTNDFIVCALPGATPNTANCGQVVSDVTPVGSYTGSASPNGTFDQGGYVYEWNETIIGSLRGMRGGSWNNQTSSQLAASYRMESVNPSNGTFFMGFRIASPVPEPDTATLLLVGLFALGVARRSRAAHGRRSPRSSGDWS